MRAIEDTDPTIENWYAFAVAIILDMNVNRALAKMGMPLGRTHKGKKPSGRKWWTEQEYKEAESMKKGGMTWREVGEAYGVSEKAARRACERHRKETRKKLRINTDWTPEKIIEIEQMRENGMKWREIAEVFGVKRTAIQNAYTYHGGRE